MIASAAILTGCASAQNVSVTPPSDGQRLVIYTAHKEEVYRPVIEEFEDQTGIWVDVQAGGTTQMLRRIRQEQSALASGTSGTIFPADIMFGGGAENTGAEQEEPEERDGRLLPLVTQNPSMNRYVRSAIRYIEEHYREENVSISTVAAALDLSEGHLSRLFKKDTGMSVSTYVTTFRIRVSMRLLRDVHCRVSEAARSAGYQDAGYFSNTFRKMTGMSPSEYQEKA